MNANKILAEPQNSSYSTTNPVFFVESPHPWWGVWQRPHQLFSRIAAYFPTYYINPLYMRNLLPEWSNFRKYRNYEDINHNRVRVNSLPQIHGERFSWILKWNQKKVYRVYQNLAQRYEGNRKILWIYDPHKYYLADHVSHDFLVYDIMDEYLEFPWSPPHIKEEEEYLLSRADVTFAGTHALYEKKKGKARKIKCYLSAVDYAHFAQAQNIHQVHDNLPKEMRELRLRFKFIIGYFGVVDQRIDWNLVIEMAKKKPECGFIFIGPVAGTLPNTQNQENIIFLGQKSYIDLPRYCQFWDSCWIPFKLNEWTRYINPTKVLEYFAMGKPVFSVKIPDIVHFYRDLIGWGESAQEFIDHIENFAAHPDSYSEGIKKGKEIAYENSWDQRVRDMLNDCAISPGYNRKQH